MSIVPESQVLRSVIEFSTVANRLILGTTTASWLDLFNAKRLLRDRHRRIPHADWTVAEILHPSLHARSSILPFFPRGLLGANSNSSPIPSTNARDEAQK